MRRNIRLAILFATLAAVAAWTAFGGKDADEPAAAAAAPAPSAPSVVLASAPSPAPAAAPSPAPVPEAAAEMPPRAELNQMGADPFSVEAARMKTEAAAQSLPVRAPAPPLPYRFAGRVHIGDAVEVYLAKGDEVVPVKKGDRLDGQYKVEKIGRSEMTLVHIASGAREKIEYGPPLKEERAAAVAATPAPQKQRAGAKSKSRTPETASLPQEADEPAGSPAEKRDYGFLKKGENGG